MEERFDQTSSLSEIGTIMNSSCFLTAGPKGGLNGSWKFGKRV
jgi:hypothetical protein